MITENAEIVALTAQVEDLAATVLRLSNELADLSAALAPVDAAPDSSPDPTPEYSAVDEWVAEYFAPMFARTIGGEVRWCPHWAEHAEAVSRLEALWRSWEVQRLDAGVGMATWFVSHLDPQLAVLLSRSGPFAQCGQDRHVSPSPLVVL